ncbi:MAG: hypothetical protein GSR77_00070 [Desulfurococcales archaeon]|nr:hypothetical protein [Desulfurococcales archaeon]
MRRQSARRGISYIASVIILLAIVAIGGAAVYNYLNNTASALAKQVEVTASAITTTNTTYVQIQLHNTGTQSVTITSVYIDNTDITTTIGLANYTLKPGQSISKVVSLNLPSGDHVVKIIFEDGSEKPAKFTS